MKFYFTEWKISYKAIFELFKLFFSFLFGTIPVTIYDARWHDYKVILDCADLLK